MWKAALMQRCPACCQAPLFEGILQVRERCAHCGTHLKSHEVGDGPAFFVMTFLCLFLSFMAGIVELAYAPPLWVHLAIWPLVTLLLSLLLLRVAKAAMIAIEFRTLPQNFTKDA